MKLVKWNQEKAIKLKAERNIELERIAVLIAEKKYLGVIDVPSRSDQKMFLLDYDDYTVCVPFVESDREIFIKTAFRSRKINKQLKG
ncbi:MAG: hypothetical protein K2X04_11655 [Burkholderiales bacterium]|nr:hypothetical protein [Burkholderiales bacterium]